jgi:uncharacterized protein
MKKIYYNWSQIEGACLDIARQINQDNFKPDYIVGISRGGLVPAVLLSQYLNIPMHPLTVSLRDHTHTETNCWMAEDAHRGTTILIVDDINDSGATIEWIKDDWQSACIPNDSLWKESVWGNNVRVATLVEKNYTDYSSDYTAWHSYDECWVVFPWEEFWHR